MVASTDPTTTDNDMDSIYYIGLAPGLARGQGVLGLGTEPTTTHDNMVISTDPGDWCLSDVVCAVVISFV